jgi:hypothetical protein
MALRCMSHADLLRAQAHEQVMQGNPGPEALQKGVGALAMVPSIDWDIATSEVEMDLNNGTEEG